MPEEIQIAPLTKTENEEYRRIQTLERTYELLVYEMGEHYHKIGGPGEACLLRPEVHDPIQKAEADFRVRAAFLVRLLISKHLSKLDGKYDPNIWEPGVKDGWFIIFRKDAVVKRL